MKKIKLNEIGACITSALEEKKKNILFVSNTLKYENALRWFEDHKDYKVFRFATPQPLHEEKNGLLIENRNYCHIDDQTLNCLNDEKAILFVNAFSEKCIYGFDEYIHILKDRFFINKFPDDINVKFSLEKLALFIAFTAPADKKDDWASLDEKYYSLFDEIYILDK